jgi:hypothetical protein
LGYYLKSVEDNQEGGGERERRREGEKVVQKLAEIFELVRKPRRHENSICPGVNRLETKLDGIRKDCAAEC